MDDLISRQAAIDALDRFSLGETDAVKLAFRMGDYLKQLPSAQTEKTCEYWDRESEFCALHRPSAQERKTGRWIRTMMPLTGAIEHRCSRCDTPYYMAFAMKMNYCPNCGADMRGDNNA